MDQPQLRVCTRCHASKPVNEFPIKDKVRGTFTSYCRPCRSEYGKEHYRKNLDYYRSKATRGRTRDRNANRKIVDAFLSEHPCVDCGEADPLVLDFDHIDPRLKTEAIGRLQHSGGRRRLLSEMVKCVVRCGNCHRRRTAIQYGWYRVWMAAHV